VLGQVGRWGHTGTCGPPTASPRKPRGSRFAGVRKGINKRIPELGSGPARRRRLIAVGGVGGSGGESHEGVLGAKNQFPRAHLAPPQLRSSRRSHPDPGTAWERVRTWVRIPGWPYGLFPQNFFFCLRKGPFLAPPAATHFRKGLAPAAHAGLWLGKVVGVICQVRRGPGHPVVACVPAVLRSVELFSHRPTCPSTPLGGCSLRGKAPTGGALVRAEVLSHRGLRWRVGTGKGNSTGPAEAKVPTRRPVGCGSRFSIFLARSPT
jgi:hypothetical protein